jgi:predicted nucleic acid-binding protein
MKYIFDTSAVIVLLEICGLKKQIQAFSTKNSLCIPNRVREEFLDGCKIDKKDVDVFSLAPPVLNEELLPYFNRNTSSGEFWTISHAFNDINCVCVIDDGFGRNLCRFLRIRHTGSVGIISEMKNQGFLSKEDLVNIREKISNSNFYLSRELIAKLDEICFA